METFVIGIFVWLFAIIFLGFSNHQNEDTNLFRQSLFWIGIILSIIGLILLIPIVIDAFKNQT